MQINPLQPEKLRPEIRYVHDEIANLVGNSKKIITSKFKEYGKAESRQKK